MQRNAQMMRTGVVPRTSLARPRMGMGFFDWLALVGWLTC